MKRFLEKAAARRRELVGAMGVGLIACCGRARAVGFLFAAYPLDLDLASRSIAVAGKTTSASGFEGPDESLIDQKAALIDSTKCGHERSSTHL